MIDTLHTLSTETYSATVARNLVKLKEEQSRFIRAQFDSSMTQAYAKTWIETARLLGFGELANDMEGDLL